MKKILIIAFCLLGSNAFAESQAWHAGAGTDMHRVIITNGNTFVKAGVFGSDGEVTSYREGATWQDFSPKVQNVNTGSGELVVSYGEQGALGKDSFQACMDDCAGLINKMNSIEMEILITDEGE